MLALSKREGWSWNGQGGKKMRRHFAAAVLKIGEDRETPLKAELHLVPGHVTAPRGRPPPPTDPSPWLFPAECAAGNSAEKSSYTRLHC